MPDQCVGRSWRQAGNGPLAYIVRNKMIEKAIPVGSPSGCGVGMSYPDNRSVSFSQRFRQRIDVRAPSETDGLAWLDRLKPGEAWHEAGHALAAWWLGGEVQEVTLESERDELEGHARVAEAIAGADMEGAARASDALMDHIEAITRSAVDW